jgi:hypothetical protein
MLNSIKPEITKESFRSHCQKNRHFASAVIQQLVSTDFCIVEPSRANRFSNLAFKFPLNTDEHFLECILDCVELLGDEPAVLAVAEDNPDGYILGIKNSSLIENIIKVDSTNPWCLAGLVFVQFNKNKTKDNNLSIIDSKMFGKRTFAAVNKLTYLLL